MTVTVVCAGGIAPVATLIVPPHPVAILGLVVAGVVVTFVQVRVQRQVLAERHRLAARQARLEHVVSEQARVVEERTDRLASLEHEHAWLTAVFERAPVALLLVPLADPPGSRVVANRCALELFGPGMDPDDPVEALRTRIRRPGGAPLPPEDFPSRRALRGETLGREELEIHRTDGEPRPVVAHAGPIRDATGDVLGAVVVLEDVSVTRELDRLREAWTAVIAHDLRSPITSIRMLAVALARQPGVPPELAEKLHLIAKAADRLGLLVRDLLDASRLTVEQLQLERRRVELDEVLDRVVERLRPQAAGRTLRLTLDGGVPTLDVDPDRLEQVVENLVTNALRYGFEGTPVDVVVHRAADATRVEVINEGPGIEPEELHVLFRRFGRTRTGRVQGSHSTGLGLYIAMGLVKAHGGDLEVQSDPDATTTFTIVLPDATCAAR